MYDIAIVGAGPAGATLARLLSGRFRVLLADKRSLGSASSTPGARTDKLCGGLLAPAAQKELARQGLGLPRDLLVGPQLFAVRSVDADSGLEQRYQRHYVNIDRAAFDGWLARLAEPVCDMRTGWRLTHIDGREPAPMLHFTTAEGGRASCSARFVVGADGAASLVRRSVDGGSGEARYVAVQAAFEATKTDSSYGAFFSRELTDYYGWAIPKGDTVLVGAAIPRGGDVRARFDTMVERMRTAGFGLGRECDRMSAPLVRPARAGDVLFGHGSLGLLGEAAGLISPSSAEGISYALRSAATMARAFELAPDKPFAVYRRLARPLVAEVVGKSAKARLLSSSGFRAAVMRSGVGSLQEGEPAGFGTTLGELLMP